MFFKAYQALMRYPLIVLFALLSLALFLASYIPQLQIDASSDTLVLEGDKSVATYREVYKEYGGSSFLVVTYRSEEGVFSAKSLEKIAQLKEDLNAIEGVRSVITVLDVPLLNSPPVTLANLSEGVNYLSDEDIDVELAKKEFLHSPMYRDLLSNREQTVTALQVNLAFNSEAEALDKRLTALRETASSHKLEQTQLKQELEQAKERRKQLEKQIVVDVRDVLQQHRAQGEELLLGGIPMIVSDMLDYVRNDMVVFGSLVIAFIVLLLTALFRAWRWVLLSLLTCGFTCVYMLGGLAFFGVKLTVVSANFVALLLILTLSVVIHLAIRCIEYERSEAADVSQFTIVMKTMRYMLKPCFYTTITTMAAFASLMASGVKPVIDFGWMMAVAVTLGLLLSFILLPAGLLLFPRTLRPKENRVSNQFTAFLACFIERNNRSITVLALAILTLSMIGVYQLKVENRFIDYFDKETEIYRGMLEIDNALGGTLPLDIVLTKHADQSTQVEVGSVLNFDDGDDFFAEDSDGFAGEGEVLSYWFTRQGMQEIAKVQKYLESIDETGKILSLATLYQLLEGLVGGDLDDVQLALMKANLSKDMQKALIAPYLSADGTQTRIALRVKETSEGLSRNGMLLDIEAYLQEEGYQQDEYLLTGMMVLYNNMLQSLFISQAITLGMVFFAVWIVMAILFRSLYVAFLALLPNVLAAFFVLGMMGWLDIPLDVMTITIGSITIGIGVDDTIHYIHRYKKELAAAGNDYLQAMHNSHASIGLAMFYTSVTIIVGFGILTFSNFTPSIYFGFLTGVAMITALFGALILLPHLLLRLKPQGLLN